MKAPWRRSVGLWSMFLVAVLSAVTGCEPEPEARVRPPRQRPPRAALTNRVDIKNVILVSIDTLRADHLGCYGHPFVKSPNIDAFAREGLLFTNHVSAAPSTLASHTSLMTGTYPHTHGVPKNGHTVSDENIMLAEMLKEAGFATAAIIGAYPLDPIFNFDQGFDYRDVEYDHFAGPKHQERTESERRGDHVTEAALKWLDGAFLANSGPNSKPERLFMFVHYFDVHWPYEAPPPYGGMYRQDKLPLDGSMATIKQAWKLNLQGDRERLKQVAQVLHAEYCAEITYCDHQLGLLLDGLKSRNLYENSLIIVTADHGETMLEHANAINHGMSVFDTEIHTPLLVRLPDGRFGGQRVDRLVSSIDVVPTILHLLDLPEHNRLEGYSFAGLINGPLPPREPVFAEATQPWWEDKYDNDPIWPNRGKHQCIRTATHKYALCTADKRAAFFNLVEDPVEHVNLLRGGREHDADLAASLRKQLEQWRDDAYPLSSPEVDEREAINRLRDLGYIGGAEDDG